ncbi:MAG: metallophosphoesterase family protein [Desulfurococcales archaeon]|nr:metallophosphoesterase family protein [Desulfurococcales archaeon]
MKILHISDIHCANDKLEKLLERIDDYDLIVATGDFQCVDTATFFVKIAKDKLAVTGNIDDPAIARVLRDNEVLLDGRIIKVRGVIIAGIGGLDFHSSLDSLRQKLGNSRVDILLSHHPPKGILDRVFFGLHAGVRELRDFITVLRPRLHLFGHIHESRGVEERNGSLFVNPGPLKRGYYALIECNNNLEYCSASLEKL